MKGETDMKKHILIDKARVYPEPESTPKPPNCTYDLQRGFWIDDNRKIPMMHSDNPKKPQSKKADIETGEDQKGE
jgi:hypothetical protein